MNHDFSSLGKLFKDGSLQNPSRLFQTSKYHSPPNGPQRLSVLQVGGCLVSLSFYSCRWCPPVEWKGLWAVPSITALHKAAPFPVVSSPLWSSHRTRWECLLIGGWWAVCGVNRFTNLSRFCHSPCSSSNQSEAGCRPGPWLGEGCVNTLDSKIDFLVS